MDTDIIELSEKLNNSDTETVWKMCTSKLYEYGVSSVFYGIVPIQSEIERIGLTQSCFYKTNHPQRWISEFGEDCMLDNDLSTEQALYAARPILWHDPSEWSIATEKQRNQAEIESTLGMRVGVTLCLASYAEHRVAAGVGLSMPQISEKDFSKHCSEYASRIQAVVGLLDAYYRESNPNALVVLTGKEKILLQFSLAGYTQKEIARKMGITYSTIEFHSRNIRRKLKSRSVEHAALKASLLGVLTT